METKNKYINNFSESSKSRMQKFEEPQFGHPWITTSRAQKREVAMENEQKDLMGIDS